MTLAKIFYLLGFCAFIQCSTNKNSANLQPENPQSEVVSGELVSFYQQGCRGYCPSYKVTVFNNGKAQYEGIRFIKTAGKAEFSLTAEELYHLRGAVERANLWPLPERIESNIADLPYTVITVYRKGASHEVTANMNKPEGYIAIEETIKNTLEAHGFLVKQGYNPDAIPAESKRQIKVLLKKETNAGNWIQSIDFPQMMLERRLGEANHWLITYDSRQIAEKDLIESLKTYPEVLECTGQ